MIAELLLALAQEAVVPDLAWTATKKDGLEAVYIEYDVGVTLSAICRDRTFILALGGLPPAVEGAASRKLEINVRDDVLRSSDWNVAPNSNPSVALSTAPSIYARRLRSADTFTVRIPADGATPARRYQLALPSDHAALDAVMTSCGVPLENVADAAYDPGQSIIVWAQAPRITVPSPLPSVNSADVLVQCGVDGEGRPQDCAILDEQPARSGFGRHALQMVRTGRLRQIDGAPFQPGSTFATRMTYRVHDR